MARGILRFLMLGAMAGAMAGAVVCCLPSFASADIWTWGENWLLDLDWHVSGERMDDDKIPLDVKLRYWRTSWRDPSVDIKSEMSAFYQFSVATTMDRYCFTLAGMRGNFNPKEPTPSFSEADRFDIELSLGYALLPTLVAFGGWKIVHYEYTYEAEVLPGKRDRVKADPMYAGFQVGLLMAIPLGNRIIPFARYSVYRLTTEGDYASARGTHFEWGLTVRPTPLALSLFVGYQTQRLKGLDEAISVRDIDERFEGIMCGLSYVFRVETSDSK